VNVAIFVQFNQLCKSANTFAHSPSFINPIFGLDRNASAVFAAELFAVKELIFASKSCFWNSFAHHSFSVHKVSFIKSCIHELSCVSCHHISFFTIVRQAC